MCGIVAGIAQRNIAPILLEGLRRLEYRGYDSAGMAVLSDSDSAIARVRTCGKVQELADALQATPLAGCQGLAHTRWATHGRPSEDNAHPQMSGERLAIVHNGIIENYEALASELKAEGYTFRSETDTEVIVHCLRRHYEKSGNLLTAVRETIGQLEGAFALAIISTDEPHTLYAARCGAPLVIGVGIEEHFVASDPLALLPVTQDFVFLAEGDVAEVRHDAFVVYDGAGQQVEREKRQVALNPESLGRGEYRHYMQKEIFEQPWAMQEALEGRLGAGKVLEGIFGADASQLATIKGVQIVACGTSYHAGLIARHWLESVGVSCQVDIASEFRYREPVVQPNTLLVTISQSGETADTLAALRGRSPNHTLSLAICNAPESTLVRESDLSLLTHAGPEIGVASTKAFTTQLVALSLLALALGQNRGLAEAEREAWLAALATLPERLEKTLLLDEPIKLLAQQFVAKKSALFLGRGLMYPVALEGALKLKEISYIHAEAYPAGELKHGPLALVDEHMPVVAIAPNNVLLCKLKSNMKEVQARGGQVVCFAEEGLDMPDEGQITSIAVPTCDPRIAPIIFTVPLQLLAYHVAVMKGTDVDQPRNLAKSVTVE